MSEQHTQGPWHFTNEPNAKRARGKFLTVLPVGDTVPVCDVNRHRGPESEANARLIAAAPELLEACEDALAATVNESTYPDGPCIAKEIRDLMRAAIAKAKGTP